MTITTDFSEDCYYLDMSFSSQNCVDCLGMHTCQYCYGSLDCANCYQCFFCQDCHGCSDTYFSSLCRNCQYCFGCTGLRNKKYYAYNQKLSKDEWEKKFSKLCPLKRKTGRRLYRQHDMDIVLRIKKFKDEGYTDEHIQSLMGSPGRGYGRQTREREKKIPKIQKDVFFDDLYEDLKEILDILKM